MRITLEPTSKVVELEVAGGARVPARIWEGTTDKGVPMHAYITRVAVNVEEDASEFARDLQETRVPSAAVSFIPLRLVL